MLQRKTGMCHPHTEFTVVLEQYTGVGEVIKGVREPVTLDMTECSQH